MYRSGAFVAEHVTPTTDEQVQPNGVDLTLEAVFEQREPGRLCRDGKEVGARSRIQPDPVVEGETVQEGAVDEETPEVGVDEETTFGLEPGGYVARYAEVVSIPEGHVGFVYPRSSLMRNSCMLHTAVWDAGYEGKGEGLLEVHHEVDLEDGARIAQLVLAEAEHEDTYEGSYQGENL